MKILQLIYESYGSPFGFGGAGVRAYEIYKRLKDRHDITLLCLKYPGAKDGEIEGLRHIYVGTESKSLTKSVFFYTIAAANFVRKYGDGFDIIIENFLPSTPFFSQFLTKTPVVLQIQGIMESHSLKKYSPVYSVPMYLVERIYPNFYKRFIFVSDITQQKVMSRIKGKNTEWFIIPNGIDEELLMTKPWDGDYILFFSRLDIYTKGLDILLQAFETISVRYPEVRLVLAGSEFDRFEHIMDRYSSLEKKVQYAGFVTKLNKINLLAGAKLFVLPSRHESAPISILEAAACKKPIITSDIPELRYVEKEGIGITFSSGSAKELAERIEELLTNSEKREFMGRKGREYASNFLWADTARRFEEVIESFV
jgi:glycosyltransferase involved in cell wall biosynthesis